MPSLALPPRVPTSISSSFSEISSSSPTRRALAPSPFSTDLSTSPTRVHPRLAVVSPRASTRSTPDATPSTRRTPHPASCVPEIASSGSSASTSNLSLLPPLRLRSTSPSSRRRSSFDRSIDPFNSLPTSFASRRANASTASNDRHLRERRRARERTKTARAFESTRVRVGRQSAASNDRARVHSIHVIHPARGTRRCLNPNHMFFI